ncbi:uncharacterized protein LOC123266314 isoform X3 [Cotesia glomerata]|uniref:uncharacterized protein LOC123266314 isoform X3 n=1 Tax=Cotesia glomerata TaxID=32391 RepID=UPI001D019092|nr:uncharacterized protein LOC123266314 isoform X3 [Cotesia glomerata]
MSGNRNNLTELIDVVGLVNNNKSELKSKSGKCNKAYANVTPKFECGKRVKFILIKKKSGQLLCAGSSGPSLVRHLHLPGGMVLWATMLVLYGVGFVGSMTGVPGVPENVTVMFLSPTSVRVSWSTSQVDQVEKYDVTYKPTDARNETIDAYKPDRLNSCNETYNETFILSYNEPYNETYDDDDDENEKSYRMVRLVAGNSDAVTLNDLQADTQYQLVITAVRAGKKYRSRPIVFRTLEPPRTSPQQDASVTGGPPIPPPPSSSNPHPAPIQVRAVEIGIVMMVLLVWAGAIALFFNRWGKIRMLLPYQPDYKEQLKVPGTGAICNPTTTPCTQHSSQHACSQHLHWSNHHVDSLDSAGGGGGAAGGSSSQGWPRSSRPRVNSAIDVAGFLSQEFLRRHGSTSRLCRKVRSADNLPLVTESSNHQDNDNNDNEDENEEEEDHCNRNSIPSQEDGNETDREFLPLTMTITTNTETNRDEPDDKTDDFESKHVVNYSEGLLKDNNAPDISINQSSQQQYPSREYISSSTITTTSIPSPSLIVRRFSGWRISGSHEYVRCPIRQPSSIDDRYFRRSCEPDFPRPSPLYHHHHHHHHHLPYKPSTSNGNPVVYHRSSDSDQSRQTSVSSVEIQHFGLPILSVSEPSPPDEKNNRLDDYL